MKGTLANNRQKVESAIQDLTRRCQKLQNEELGGEIDVMVTDHHDKKMGRVTIEITLSDHEPIDINAELERRKHTAASL